MYVADNTIHIQTIVITAANDYAIPPVTHPVELIHLRSETYPFEHYHKSQL